MQGPPALVLATLALLVLTGAPATFGQEGRAENCSLETNWPLFTIGLVQRGHSDEVIRQIVGGNMLRVCRAALKPA